jgi:hypothetical protein
MKAKAVTCVSGLAIIIGTAIWIGIAQPSSVMQQVIAGLLAVVGVILCFVVPAMIGSKPDSVSPRKVPRT